MLPGSVESGVLLSPNVSVPPLCVLGFTAPVMPALKVADVEPLELLLPLLPPLPPQAASTSAASAPRAAASPIVLRLFMG